MMKNLKKPLIRTFTVLTIFCALFISCKSVKDVQVPDEEIKYPEPEHPVISRNLTDAPVLSDTDLYLFFMSQNPDADREMIQRMAFYYIREAKTEGINSDCAWAQMCLETGYLRFGNLVTPEMHNYCGLGAIDAEHPGEVFETEPLGVRAHIQHLHAYATTEEAVLKNELIDKRYKWVRPRGKAPTIFELAGTWAADRSYGEKLDAILTKMELSTTM